MTRLTTLLFDVDGTLAETEEVHRQSFNSAFREAGLDWDWTQALYADLLAVTGGKERIKHYLALHRPSFAPPGDLDGFVAELHAAKTRYYTDTVAAGRVPLRPGVRRLLASARDSGLRLGIATTTTPANVIVLLEKSLAPDAPAWFDVIAAGGVVPRKKPAPDIYDYAMEKLGVSPDECLAFEDSENGLLSAQTAGLETLVTVSQYTAGQDFSAARVIVDQLGEPDAPCRTLKGPAPARGYVDVEFIRSLAGDP
jgi:HAD superfamily hydrolase (TIGR01509 family)